ncbi:MAG: shikimate kinase [candidate division KSB1 bacterium]|nr:shikimate kinase [candidate division KSB1 bacterium]MDZ7335190.1 shikimate kinase [candidate division KSB1 bacterium]MDZ7356523.1 shikimate kinase [candidate division KSB1 bacterium]MDZ7400732.1 shikimate kinase [candidate division KSB1 bacterium]
MIDKVELSLPSQPVPLIYLTGFMASGKSTVGYALAEALHRDFFDLDVEIETRLGKPIAQIFKDEGAAFFREIESQILMELSQRNNAVIALGGGTLIDIENLSVVQNSGISIWLATTPEEIWKRIEYSDKRQLIAGPDSRGRVLTDPNQIYDRIKSLMLIRKPSYEKADIIIDATNKSVSQIVQEILMLLEPYQFLR